MLTLNHLLLNREYSSESLGFDRFYVYSLCNLSIEDYAKIFDVTYKWDVPSIQCKMSLNLSMSMRETYGLNRIVIDFYVPAFTPHSSEVRLCCSFLRT
jgi:hypothetical protein